MHGQPLYPKFCPSWSPLHADDAFVPQGLWLQSYWPPEPGRGQSQVGTSRGGDIFSFLLKKRNLHLTIFKAQSSVLLLTFVILFLLQHLIFAYFRGTGHFLFYSLQQSTVRFTIQLYTGKVKYPLYLSKDWYLFYLKNLYNINSLPWCSQRGLKNY